MQQKQHPVLGARQRRNIGVDHPAEAGARRRDVESVAIDRRLGGDRIGDKADHRRAERQNVDKLGPQERRAAGIEEMLGRGVDLTDDAGGVDRQQRLRQSVEKLQRVERRAGGPGPFGRHHAASVCGRDAKASANRRSASSASSLVTSAQRNASGAPAFSA